MLLCESTIPSFLFPSSIALYRYITIYVSIYRMIHIWVVSQFWLLQIKLLLIFVWKFLCRHLSFLKYLEVECLGPMGGYMFKFLRKCQVLPKVGSLFCIPTSSTWIFWLFLILANTWYVSIIFYFIPILYPWLHILSQACSIFIINFFSKYLTRRNSNTAAFASKEALDLLDGPEVSLNETGKWWKYLPR